jgi:transporter family protein
MSPEGWIVPALIAAGLWGIVGVLQKLGVNRVSASSLLAWVMVGYVIVLPLFWNRSEVVALSPRALCLGIIAGAANGLGTWSLFEALQRGAKASVAIPLTALYPLVTTLLAVIFLHERLTVSEGTAVVLALWAAVMLSFETETAKPIRNDAARRQDD